MRKLLVPLALVLAGLATPGLAQDSPPCAARNDIVGTLKSKFSENTSGVGLTDEGAAVELMTSENGTWSLLLSFPNGRSCLMATGSNWEGTLAKPPGRES